MTVLSRVSALAIAGVVLTSTAACASKSSPTAAGPSAAAPKTAVSTSASATSSSSTSLAKADFVKQADAICARYDKQLKLVTEPQDETDYAAISRYLQASVTLYQGFAKELAPLVARTADATALDSNWLAVDRDSITQVKPALVALTAAVKANDPAAAKKALAQVDAVPDHTTEITAYLKGYGLSDCAALEGS